MQGFRNHEKSDYIFSKWGAFFFGDNGTGKTNIIEAIYMLAFFKSFRSAGMEHMIKWGMQNASIIAFFEDADGLEHSLNLFFNKKKRFVC